jgi:hypothetical protein
MAQTLTVNQTRAFAAYCVGCGLVMGYSIRGIRDKKKGRTIILDIDSVNRKIYEKGWSDAKQFYIKTGDIMPYMPME